MVDFKEWSIEAKGIESLVWRGDTLIDWIAEKTICYLDGSIKDRPGGYGYRFDAAVESPSGNYAVIYEKLGTKGIIVRTRDERIIREIDRSFEEADIYEFPVALFALPDGREVIAHCPTIYAQLEIDELETGKRLTESANRKSINLDLYDLYHSRLAANTDGTYLLSAGWEWHPWDVAHIYDLEAALNDPAQLDMGGIKLDVQFEVSSAAFLGNEKVVISSSSHTYDKEREEPWQVVPHALYVYDLSKREIISNVKPEDNVGTVMPVNEELVMGFYEHPKLISLKTGATISRWPNLEAGKQTSSLIGDDDLVPPLALDPVNRRFAVANKTMITVVQINPG